LEQILFQKLLIGKERDCVFFGDGAGAAIMTSGNVNEGFQAFSFIQTDEENGILQFQLEDSDIPASKESLEKGLHYFQMNGREVYNTAIKVLPEAISQVLKDTGLTVADIDYMISSSTKY